ncbi:unnamed protein product [Musa acuminata var. zebrina]
MATGRGSGGGRCPSPHATNAHVATAFSSRREEEEDDERASDSMKVLSRSDHSPPRSPGRGRFACAASDRPLLWPHSSPPLSFSPSLNAVPQSWHRLSFLF